MTRILTIAAIVWLGMLRRKDIYVLLLLLGALLVMLVSLNIFGLGGVTGYVKDVGLMAAWVFAWILAVTISTRELPQEEAQGTIFPLLAKPVTRLQVVLGKWVGCWSIVTAATLVFYLLVALVVQARGGHFFIPTLCQAFFLHAVALGILVALGLLFSARMHQDAAAALTYVLTAAAVIVVPRVPELLVRESGPSGTALLVLYYLAPHFELLDMRRRLVHGYEAVDGRVFLAVVLYGLLTAALYVLLAWLAYRRKRFVRGNLSE